MITINESERIDADNVFVKQCTVSTVAEITSDLPAFARDYEFQHGSVAICQENSEVYTMNPDYTWTKLGGE